MRRKQGALVPLEHSILEAAAELRSKGFEEFHGFQLAKAIEDKRKTQWRWLTGYGTLYRALERLEGFGYLSSH